MDAGAAAAPAAGDAAPGPDLLDGGIRECCSTFGDRVSYRGRTAPVSVDLSDPRADGEAGERDVLRRIQSIEGGSGDDRLIGDDRSNVLIGRTGTDRLSGRGGMDTLMPGRGGGPIDCGDGDDLVYPSSSRDRLDADCEIVDVLSAYGTAANPRQVGPNELTFHARCPENPDDTVDAAVLRCSGVVHVREARAPHRLLASGRFPLGLWRSRSVRLRVTPLGRRLASRAHGVRAVIRLAIRAIEPGSRPRSAITDSARWGINLRLTS